MANRVLATSESPKYLNGFQPVKLSSGQYLTSFKIVLGKMKRKHIYKKKNKYEIFTHIKDKIFLSQLRQFLR